MLREFEDRVTQEGRHPAWAGRIGAVAAWVFMAALIVGGLRTVGIL